MVQYQLLTYGILVIQQPLYLTYTRNLLLSEVTDTNNCKSIDTVTIVEPSLISTTENITNVSCNGFSNGKPLHLQFLEVHLDTQWTGGLIILTHYQLDLQLYYYRYK